MKASKFFMLKRKRAAEGSAKAVEAPSPVEEVSTPEAVVQEKTPTPVEEVAPEPKKASTSKKKG